MNSAQVEKQRRFDWYANQVKFKFADENIIEPENPTPVFPALDYTQVSPPLNTFHDNDFFNRSNDLMAACRLSLHIFFSLPARALDPSGLKKRALQTELGEAESVSKSGAYTQYVVNKTSNRESAARRLFHRAVMSEGDEMKFVETYRKMNDLVKGANLMTRELFKQSSALFRPFRADSRIGRLPEDATKAAFAATLDPIVDLFNELWGSDLEFDTGSTIYDYNNQFDEDDEMPYTAIPDIAVKENGKPLVCIKVKYPLINIDDPGACSEMFTQAVSECICSGSPYGVVTDYLSTLCFKLELEAKDIKNVKNSTYGTDVESEKGMFKYVRVSCVRVKHDAPVNTLACVLAAHIFNAREDMLQRRDEYRVLLLKLGAALQLTSAEIEIRNQQSYNGFLKYLDRTRQRNFDKVKITLKNKVETTVNLYDALPFDDSNMKVIQEGESYNAQALVITEDVFKKLTAKKRHIGGKPSTSRYLLKIFDPVRGKKVHRDFTFTEASYRKHIKHTFYRELTVYDKLKSLWGKCIPRLYHSGICHLTDSDDGDIKFGGLFLIIEFIEGTSPDFSREDIQQSARDALTAMHDLGIVHGDMSSRNMIQHEDQVFLLDFGLSLCEKTEANYNNVLFRTDLEDFERKDLEALEKTIMNYHTDHPTTTRLSSL